ncbi:MAG: F0F1 ATP synthase subunit B [Dethiobacteria bacterium]|jgi:F-type H+-transporting ATPase subunit b
MVKEIFQALGFEPASFLFQAFNVLVIILLLYKFLWKPLTQSMANREEKISGDLREAALAREKAEEMIVSYQQRLEKANQEGQAILERAAKMAEGARAEILAQAKEEAARAMEQARMEIEKEKRKALAAIRNQAADLVVVTTGKVLARTLSPGDHEHLVREALTEVERLQ